MTHHQMKIANIVAIAIGVPILAPMGKPGFIVLVFSRLVRMCPFLPVDMVAGEPGESDGGPTDGTGLNVAVVA